MKSLDRTPRNTLSAADWERAALELIAEQGVQALAVEPLARRGREAALKQRTQAHVIINNENFRGFLTHTHTFRFTFVSL